MAERGVRAVKLVEEMRLGSLEGGGSSVTSCFLKKKEVAVGRVVREAIDDEDDKLEEGFLL